MSHASNRFDRASSDRSVPSLSELVARDFGSAGPSRPPRQGLALDRLDDEGRLDVRQPLRVPLTSIGLVRLSIPERPDAIGERATSPPLALHRLTLAMGFLSAAVLVLAAFAVFRPLPDVVVQGSPIVDGTMAQSEGLPERTVARARTKPVREAIETDVPRAVEAPAPEPAVEAEPSRPSSSKPRSVKSPKPAVVDSAPVVASPKPTPTAESLSVDCILDPASCDRGAATPSESPKPTPTAKDLPDKLSTAQIRAALAVPKADAKRCASEGSGLVKVKLSIANDGTVVDADAIEDHAGTPLGACVAATLGKARFPAFAQSRMGIVYSVRL